MEIVLASSSPRRKRLLGRVVKGFSVAPANASERMMPGESFPSACVRLALAKAGKVASKRKSAIVIGADTIAFRGKRVYRKTSNEKAAGRILMELRGKTHFVVTGVAVVFPGGRAAKYSVRAAVKMRNYGEKEIGAYLRAGEWKGRAGCYDVSGKGRKLVQSVKGEKETVVGLPLIKLRRLLARARLSS